MVTGLSDISLSHRSQLGLVAAASAAATLGTVLCVQTYQRRQRRKELGEEVRRKVAALDSGKAKVVDGEVKAPGVNGIDEDEMNARRLRALGDADKEEFEAIVREQLARNYALFGEEGMARVRKGGVVVVGCGGVGSWAAVMLVRSGITRIRLVDFDQVSLSSLNRHATATAADVGTPKVYCVEKALKAMIPWVEVDARTELWKKEDGARLLEGYDWVVDAIDNIGTKVDLLKYCYEHDMKVFASMGAGAKFDPTRVQIADISNTIYDPLARSVRIRLRKLGVPSGIPTVYSTEPASAGLLPLPDEEFQKGQVGHLAPHDGFRVRIMPVLGPLPAIFGLHIASYIICAIAGQPIANPLPVKNRRRVYEKMLRELLSREQKHTEEQILRLPIDEDDVAIILEDLHRGRSVIPPHGVPNKPSLTRWNPREPLSLENCVVMDAGDLDKQLRECEKGGKAPAEVWGEGAEKVVQRRRGEVRAWRDAVL